MTSVLDILIFRILVIFIEPVVHKLHTKSGNVSDSVTPNYLRMTKPNRAVCRELNSASKRVIIDSI